MRGLAGKALSLRQDLPNALTEHILHQGLFEQLGVQGRRAFAASRRRGAGDDDRGACQTALAQRLQQSDAVDFRHGVVDHQAVSLIDAAAAESLAAAFEGANSGPLTTNAGSWSLKSAHYATVGDLVASAKDGTNDSRLNRQV